MGALGLSFETWDPASKYTGNRPNLSLLDRSVFNRVIRPDVLRTRPD